MTMFGMSQRRRVLIAALRNAFRFHSAAETMPDPSTYLAAAVTFGAIETLEKLKAEGASLTHRWPGGVTPIHMAATHGHRHVIKWLHAHGVPLDLPTDSGAQPIHLAALSGHIDTVMYLVDNGQSLDARTAFGATPLHCAAGRTSLAMARWLRRHGADPHASMRTPHDELTTPLSMASAACRPWLERTRECCTLLHFALVEDGCEDDGWISDIRPEEEASGEYHPAAVFNLTHPDAGLGRELAVGSAVSHPDGSSSRVRLGIALDPETRVRCLLRSGADVHARAHPGASSPLDMAREIARRERPAISKARKQAWPEEGEARQGQGKARPLPRLEGGSSIGRAAALIIAAAEPWSAANHGTHPAQARAQANALVRIGYQLSAQREEMRGQEQALSDVWVAHVMPRAVERATVEEAVLRQDFLGLHRLSFSLGC